MIPPALTAVLNHLLTSEPSLRQRLAQHAGKIMRVESGLASIRLQVAADGLFQAVPGERLDAPDSVSMFVRWADLPLLLEGTGKAMSVVRIEGDADFASVLARVAQELRWDAEADLSRVVGDAAAHRLGQLARGALQGARATQNRLQETLAEYLSEERPVLTPAQLMTDFTEELRRLQDDGERLAKRVERLERQIRQRSAACS